MPIRDQEAFLPGLRPPRCCFLANRGANGIDGLISSGIGAALATGRPTWIVTGDLGLFHDMNALATLRHADVPVRIVVVNNDGGGIFEFLPQAGRSSATSSRQCSGRRSGSSRSGSPRCTGSPISGSKPSVISRAPALRPRCSRSAPIERTTSPCTDG